ncbi:unnamed protein product, partial [Ilex paraguariensis]
MGQTAAKVAKEDVTTLQAANQTPPMENTNPTLGPQSDIAPLPKAATVITTAPAPASAPIDATPTTSVDPTPTTPLGEAFLAQANAAPTSHSADTFFASIDELFGDIGGDIDSK